VGDRVPLIDKLAITRPDVRASPSPDTLDGKDSTLMSGARERAVLKRNRQELADIIFALVFRWIR